MAYRRQEHHDHVLIGVVKPSDFDEQRQRQGSAGALFSHMCMSAYERIAARLQAWGVAAAEAGDVSRILVDADTILDWATEAEMVDREKFEDAVLSFFDFDNQKGWPAGHFAANLTDDFRAALLLQGERGGLDWTDEMYLIWDRAPSWPIDADEFFSRVCAER